MPGFDGTGPWGPWCMGARLGRCMFPGGGFLFNIAVIGVGAYLIGRLLSRTDKTAN